MIPLPGTDRATPPAAAPPAARARAVMLLSLGFVLALLIAPELAPHATGTPVGPPYRLPGELGLLGTDHLGRDVLSRVLHGGRALLLTSLAAALCGTGAGALVGLLAALPSPVPRRVGAVLLRPLDVLAAIPPILVVLLVLAALPGRVGLIVAVAVTAAPLSARVAFAAARLVSDRAHTEAAVARGESWTWLLGREVLPLVAGPLLADFGVRFATAVYLVAAVGFLGLSTADSDWGLLVVEALPGAALQPWALIVPMTAIAALTVGVNLACDRVARRARGLVA